MCLILIVWWTSLAVFVLSDCISAWLRPRTKPVFADDEGVPLGPDRRWPIWRDLASPRVWLAWALTVLAAVLFLPLTLYLLLPLVSEWWNDRGARRTAGAKAQTPG
jgi:hypothetical protein